MNNPYEVLGLREGASQDEIKAAYRELVKKYHPDRHMDNPLNDLAEEKLQEINEAYDMLTGGHGKGHTGSQGYGPGSSRGAGYAGAGYAGNGYAGAGAGGSSFFEVRSAIDRGDLASAESKLRSINLKSAEWYYLFGLLNVKKGWFNDGMNNIQQAVAMDPGNAEYRSTLNSLMAQSGNYQQASYQRGYNNADNIFCQALQCYCCADLCCDCI
jgi:molecular chaperone DnaJ